MAGTALGWDPHRLHVELDDDGRLAGLEFSPASDQLPERLVDALRDGARLSWEPFVAELAEFAERQRLGFEFSHERGPLRGLAGVKVTCVVTGRFSQITYFAEYARGRLELRRDDGIGG